MRTTRNDAESKAAEALSDAELDELVASADTGGRDVKGLTHRVILCVALAWSLFQFWFASPIPFAVGFGVFNDTEARSIHLAFAIFLAFAAFPAVHSTGQLVLGLGALALLAALFTYGSKARSRSSSSRWPRSSSRAPCCSAPCSTRPAPATTSSRSPSP
jgi:hypothetical protein